MADTAASLRVAYMGPPRSFSHAAALRRYGTEAELVVTRTIPDAIDAAADGSADYAIVPLENSIEGGVNATLDALFESDLTISGELVLDVELCLLARSADLSQIRRVTSHPQPLGQCKRWLREHLPDAEVVVASSTTTAAQEAFADPQTAAVGSRLAAEIGLLVVREGIQDHAGNATRFVIVGRELTKPTGNDKTTLVFKTPHERGALRRVLEVFDQEGLNLTRIESRPLPGQLWEYAFFTDVEGHREDPPVARSLERLRAGGAMVRVLGSYPRASAVAE
ncbi:MAG TPA: prephenate dehydratase [Polyangiaceae bacterium]|nr:prephenate dehydratase [Polyangiaceae bacterium]